MIHNPLHAATKTNLALLGVASGYFSRVEISSKDTLQTSLLSELGQIARDYIKTVGTRDPAEDLYLSASRPPFQGTSDANAKQGSSYPVSLNCRPLPRKEGILTVFVFQASVSFQSVQDPPHEERSGEGVLSEAIHGDLTTLAFEPAFADGVDLTSFFAAEMRDFFDASAMDLFSEQ